MTSTLENKYIDILHVCNIRCAEEINDGEIQAIKARLDQFEAYCAKIEADLTQQSKERIITEKNVISCNKFVMLLKLSCSGGEP